MFKQEIFLTNRYVPWNLHEPEQGNFDFGNGSGDMSDFLDLVTFIRIAQEEDLFVILRPGPYICSEWDFGGLPRLYFAKESNRNKVNIFLLFQLAPSRLHNASSVYV